MELTKSQVEAISLEITKKTGTKCPACGQSNCFSISQHVNHLISGKLKEDGDVSLIGATFLPVIAVTCTNCAHISFFNYSKLKERLTEK
ncbi:hypothetical protein [Bacteroides oleiciplenus]|uniref:hypothetical protein n=1 Tax=Bacteroides oleiciplenus TaxID=626931 RepID=UPI0026DB10CD|nr:hypothetical protein [Bacteroides oleiciplenus]